MVIGEMHRRQAVSVLARACSSLLMGSCLTLSLHCNTCHAMQASGLLVSFGVAGSQFFNCQNKAFGKDTRRKNLLDGIDVKQRVT